MNFWIKVRHLHATLGVNGSEPDMMQTIYNANGSNASWEWLEKISPCIDVLRQLATHMNDTLGSRLGQKHHTPDISKDLRKLLDTLRSKAVYEIKLGRTVDSAKVEVPNVVTAGFRALAGPLREHNERFERMRRRYRETPLVGSGTFRLFLVSAS